MQDSPGPQHAVLALAQLACLPEPPHIAERHVAEANIVPPLMLGKPQGNTLAITTPRPQQPTESQQPKLSSIRSGITQAGRQVSIQVVSGIVAPVKRLRKFLRSGGRQIVPVADTLASVAEAVPIFGPVVKGPLDALVKILNGVEQRLQNTEDIERLKHKLDALNTQLADHPANPKVTRLISELEGHCRKLEKLSLVSSRLDYQHSASTIAQCERDISHSIDVFSATLNAETNELVKRQILALQMNCERQDARLESLVALITILASDSQLKPNARQFIEIIVVDPFGLRHVFTQFPDTYKALGIAMLERYSGDNARRPIIQRYANQLELTKSNGQRVTFIAEKALCSLPTKTTVALNIVTYNNGDVNSVQCPLCKTSIVLPEEHAKRALCLKCDSNVVTEVDQVEDKPQDPNVVAKVDRVEAKAQDHRDARPSVVAEVNQVQEEPRKHIDSFQQPEVPQKRAPQEDTQAQMQIVMRPSRTRRSKDQKPRSRRSARGYNSDDSNGSHMTEMSYVDVRHRRRYDNWEGRRSRRNRSTDSQAWAYDDIAEY